MAGPRNLPRRAIVVFVRVMVMINLSAKTKLLANAIISIGLGGRQSGMHASCLCSRINDLSSQTHVMVSKLCIPGGGMYILVLHAKPGLQHHCQLLASTHKFIIFVWWQLCFGQLYYLSDSDLPCDSDACMVPLR